MSGGAPCSPGFPCNRSERDRHEQVSAGSSSGERTGCTSPARDRADVELGSYGRRWGAGATGHVVTDNNFNYSGGYKLKNTPDVSLGGPASGPCNGFSGGIGVGLPGMSIGANMSTVDKGCEARETARIAAMLGRMDIANAVLEHISLVEEAMKAKATHDAAVAAASTGAVESAVAPPARPVPARTATPSARPSTIVVTLKESKDGQNTRAVSALALDGSGAKPVPASQSAEPPASPAPAPVAMHMR